MLALSLALSLGFVASIEALPTREVVGPSALVEKRTDLGVPSTWRVSHARAVVLLALTALMLMHVLQEDGTSLVQSQRNTVAVNAMNTMTGLGGAQQSVGGLGAYRHHIYHVILASLDFSLIPPSHCRLLAEC